MNVPTGDYSHVVHWFSTKTQYSAGHNGNFRYHKVSKEYSSVVLKADKEIWNSGKYYLDQLENEHITLIKEFNEMSSTKAEDMIKEAIKKDLFKDAVPVEAVEEPAPVVEEKEPPMKKGQQRFSKLFKVKVPKRKDIGVTVYDRASILKEIVGFIPEVDEAYKLQVDEALDLVAAFESGDKTLITGPTGSGKSSLVEYVCAITNRPMIRINMSGDVESSTIFGMLTAKDGSTIWVDGAVTEAVRYGAVCVVDEWDVTPPEIMFGMQYLLEDKGKLLLKEMPGTSEDKLIHPHADFRMVCLGNTLGQGDETGGFAGTNVQNSATLDRFQTTIKLDYLDSAHEVGVIMSQCSGIEKASAQKLVQFANLVRTAHKQGSVGLTVSPRTLINAGRKAVIKGNDNSAMYAAIEVAFLNKLRDSDRKTVTEFYTKTFGPIKR